MSANGFRPHVYVLPEDDANRQIANGFLLDASLDSRAIQVLPSAGGWAKVRDEFAAVHTKEMRKCQHRHMVLLVDFDEIVDRAANVKSAVPDELIDRVFVVGVWSKPEDLRADMGNLELIGRNLAADCRENTVNAWNHPLLRHNSDELARMTRILRPILFPSL